MDCGTQFLEVCPVDLGTSRAVRHFYVLDVNFLSFVNRTEYIGCTCGVDQPTMVPYEITVCSKLA